LKQFIKAIPIVFDTGTPKPAGSRPATSGEHGSRNHNRQSEGDSNVEQSTHGDTESGETAD
jgi:hypothetical protein